jgi:hypothetical protein
VTANELRKLYPNCSEAFVRANATAAVGGLQNTVTQFDPGQAVALSDGRKENSAGDARLRVTITSYRRRLLDPDNPCPKFLIDALRYAHLIPDDSPAYITLEIRQKLVDTKAQEGTLVEICPVYEAAPNTPPGDSNI